jgi:Na+-transporting NADH:ubiquinone oxidoreductase subunit C
MKGKISMIIFIVILGSILTTALVAVENYTAPLIERNAELKRKASILNTFGIPYQEDDIEQVFLDHIRGRGRDEAKYYVSKDEMFAFVFTGSGLWGPIEGVLSLKQDLKSISRVEIMRQEETPGLGGRIAERTFLDRFNDKMFVPHLEMVPEGKSQENNEIDSITGATMSSEAFITILNTQYEQFSEIVAGE